MLEGVDLGFDQNKMVFSACRDCACFRAFKFDGNAGFCCSEGKVENCFIPFDYPLLDKDARKRAILKYNENPLPDDCVFHTQCSMLCFMDDESAIDEIASDEYEIEEKTVGELDLSGKIFNDVLERDASLRKWCCNVKDAIAILLKKDGEIHGFAFLTIEKDYDYTWIQPHPPAKHYFQKGESRLGIRQLYADDAIHNAYRILLSLAFMKAIEKNADEIYAISYSDTLRFIAMNGFKHVGYMFGGDGGDDDASANVLVRKLNDLEAGQ